MRGRITDWNDDRGFGFIEPESGGERVFLHISGMVRGSRRPAIGDVVSYVITRTSDGKTRAANVRPAGFAAAWNALMSRRVLLSIVALSVFPVLWWFVKQGGFPALLFWFVTGMSLVTFALYGLDKWTAIRETQRTPENTLHICALLGGWPGALLAQQVFRHKSSKRSFQITFWFTMVLNCGVLGFMGTPTGAALVRQILEAQ
ncbi:MAG TPA: cold shock and DUF1294 domain-containing protein [Hyphomicrobiales bacterium]|nr:cold shock and DUF1294 domain-containing protein [Hyphomicrobiales bacterium]